MNLLEINILRENFTKLLTIWLLSFISYYFFLDKLINNLFLYLISTIVIGFSFIYIGLFIVKINNPKITGLINKVLLLDLIFFLIGLTILHPWVSAFLFAIFFIVFVHERGHYYFMKKFGVKVKKIAIFIGPSIYKKTLKNGIEFSINLLPLGGYVATVDDDEIIKKNKIIPQGSIYNKKIWQQLLIYGGGILMNILTFIILTFTIVLGISYNKLVNKPISQQQINEYVEKNKKIISKQKEILDKSKEKFNPPINKDSIWLGGKGVKSDSIIDKTIKEVKNGFSYLLYTLSYMINNFNSDMILYGTSSIVGLAIEVDINPFIQNLLSFLILLALINLLLAITNLIPFPGLDGWHIFKSFFLYLISKLIRKDYTSLIYNPYVIILENIGVIFLFTLGFVLIFKDIFIYLF